MCMTSDTDSADPLLLTDQTILCHSISANPALTKDRLVLGSLNFNRSVWSEIGSAHSLLIMDEPISGSLDFTLSGTVKGSVEI